MRRRFASGAASLLTKRALPPLKHLSTFPRYYGGLASAAIVSCATTAAAADSPARATAAVASAAIAPIAAARSFDRELAAALLNARVLLASFWAWLQRLMRGAGRAGYLAALGSPLLVAYPAAVAARCLGGGEGLEEWCWHYLTSAIERSGPTFVKLAQVSRFPGDHP